MLNGFSFYFRNICACATGLYVYETDTDWEDGESSWIAQTEFDHFQTYAADYLSEAISRLQYVKSVRLNRIANIIYESNLDQKRFEHNRPAQQTSTTTKIKMIMPTASKNNRATILKLRQRIKRFTRPEC